MKLSRLRAALGAFALVLPTWPVGARPDPADPAVAVPPVVHRPVSSLAAPSAASAPLSWRDANDRVGRIGGWRAYAREAQSAASAPAHRR
jgi:hypothetical protein